MPAHLKNCLLALIATVTLIACLGRTQQAQADTPAEKKAKDAEKKQAAALEKQAKELRKMQEANGLLAAYLLLHAANSDAAGHKNKAINEVRQALTLVDPAAMKQNGGRIASIQQFNKTTAAQLVVNRQGINFESQVLSDSQVYNAGLMLRGIVPALQVDKQRAPLQHVGRALKEIEAVLKDSAANNLKGREADVLTYAYILLAAANQDTGGHKNNAMNQLKQACNIIDAKLLSHASVELRIKAIQDANAQGLAQGLGNAPPPVHELAYRSANQMLMAQALIQRVGNFMLLNTPKSSVLPMLVQANAEIALALVLP